MANLILRYTLPISSLAMALALVVGCGDSSDSPPPGSDTTTGVDAGGKADSGSTPEDSGSTNVDAGNLPEDSGSTDVDASDSGSQDDAGSDASVQTYAVGGTLSGLAGTGLVLQNNAGDDLGPTADGAFKFATKIAAGQPYAVSVKTQPSGPSQTCTVSDGSGTIGAADVTNVTVTCVMNTYDVGGTVSGLPSGNTLVLSNGGEDLSIIDNVPFHFTTKVASGAGYDVTIKTQPDDAYCVVNAGKGTVAGAAVTNIDVKCSPSSCAAIKDLTPNAADGPYTLTTNDGTSYSAYCDMTTDGGGWTLAIKVDGASNQFSYGAAAWTDDTTVNELSPDLSTNDAKYASFSKISFSAVRVAFNNGGTITGVSIPQAGTSLTDLFGSGYQPTTIGRATWLSLVPQSGIQANCNMEGFNVDVPMYAAARIGILANQENDCGSPDSYIGIGTSGTTCSGQEVSSGNKAACDPVLDVNGAQVGTQYHPTFGYVFIR